MKFHLRNQLKDLKIEHNFYQLNISNEVTELHQLLQNFIKDRKKIYQKRILRKIFEVTIWFQVIIEKIRKYNNYKILIYCLVNQNLILIQCLLNEIL